jgi:hypothetical protein
MSEQGTRRRKALVKGAAKHKTPEPEPEPAVMPTKPSASQPQPPVVAVSEPVKPRQRMEQPTRTPETLKAPSGLHAPGRALWASVCDRYELTSGELEVLRQAARAVDTADKIERELRTQPLTVEGHAGQPRANPLLKTLQDQQLLIRRLVDSLCLPSDGQAVGRTVSQRHASKAARARWERAS